MATGDEGRRTSGRFDPAPPEPEVVAESAAMRGCVELVEAAAESATPVMFLGEKGVGKRFLARRLHAFSARNEEPCLVVSCAEFAEGRVSRRFLGGGVDSLDMRGILEAGNGGGIILSDLEQMPVGVQKELAHFLSGYDLSGTGGGKRPGTRIMTTINIVRDPMSRVILDELVDILGEAIVRVPPLRARREDLPRLAALALEKTNAETGRNVLGFSAGAMDFLAHYDFPGNIGELRRLVSRAARLARGGEIYREDFGIQDGSVPADDGAASLLPLAEVERRHINRALMHAGWKRRAAARILGLSETMLDRKIKLYGLERDA